MGKTRGDNLAAAIALGEPGGERSGPGPLLARYVGVAVMFVGLAGLAPLAVLPAYPDEVALAPCFIFPGIGAAMAGYLVYFASPDPAPGARLTRGQAAACTVLVWVLAIAVYALPYVAAGLLSPVQAVFESTSGLTTTGLSVVDVDTCPAIFLFHRSLTCYLGGVGLVLILTCVVTQTGGLGVYNAEGHTDHLLPSAAKTARMILLIYNGLIIAGAVAYWAAGAFALILCGATLQEAVFDFISCLGSTGVGTGFLGTESGPAPLLIGSAGMLLGRLEIIPLFMGVGTLASMIRKGVRHGR